MPNPHTLGRSSENGVTLLADTFLHKVENLTRLRVILRQPSPHWGDFGISNFSVISSLRSKEQSLVDLQQVLCGQINHYEIDLLRT